jgi:predicted CXXCH cytochrome family protein
MGERDEEDCLRGTPATLARASLAALPLVLAFGARSQVASPGPPRIGKPHPRLVSLAATRCTTCHQQILAGKPNLHAPVEDCSACHALEVSGEATSVALTAPQPQLCVRCHAASAPAAAGRLKSSHAPVAESCVRCHDPHASAQPRLLNAPLRELCAGCHERAGLQKSHAGQLVESTNCVSCHVAHGSDNKRMLVAAKSHAPFGDGSCAACHRAPLGGRVRLQARGEALCVSCHADAVKVPDAGSAHAALKGARGAAGCLSCHSPHMSANAALLLKPGPELCATCHAEVLRAARAKGGHAPAAENCAACHKPHTAPQPLLLSKPPPALCANCHDLAGAAIRRAHLGSDLERSDCQACHSPHGAGHAKLLAKYVHAAMADGCSICHAGAADKLIKDGGPEQCLSCHREVGKKADAAKVQHAALLAGKCTLCHNPHASAREKLVKGAAGGPCLDCHAAEGLQKGEVAHGAIDMLGCAACHEPHGGDNPKLLVAAGSELCLSCHGPSAIAVKEGDATFKLAGRFEIPAARAKAIRTILMSRDGKRGHPTPGHPLVGAPDTRKPRVKVTFTGELGCLSCHDPHKGRTVKLLKGGAATATEACLQCHPK